MKKIKLLLFVVLISVFSAPAFAQVPELIKKEAFRKDAKQAVDSIYNFQFKGAEKSLSAWQQEYPDHPLWTLLKGMKLWWSVLSDLESTSHDQKFFSLMKQADYEARKLLYDQPSHADGLIIKAISNGYLARQYSNRSEWITSLNYARKALKSYKYLKEIQPNLPDLKLAEGLKLYYAAYLPEAYPVVNTVSWFLPEGNKPKGLALLEKASDEAVFAGAEATYFLGNINYNYEKEYGTAVKHFEQLQAMYPNNNYYTRLLVKVYYRQHRYQKASQLIEQSLERWKRLKLPFNKVLKEELLTWRGRILEKQSRTSEALACYRQAFSTGSKLPHPKKRAFRIVAGYRAGNLLFEQQQFHAAEPFFRAVAQAEVDHPYQQRAQERLSEMP